MVVLGGVWWFDICIFRLSTFNGVPFSSTLKDFIVGGRMYTNFSGLCRNDFFVRI